MFNDYTPMTEATPQKTLTTREKISLSKTKYTKSYLMEKGAEYIDSILNAKPEDKPVPSVVGFCLASGISRSRLYELANQWQEVADILEYLSMMQEELALRGGLTNKTNPIFSMFLLKSKHHYQDAPQTLTQNNTFNVSPELLSDALQLMAKNKKPE